MIGRFLLAISIVLAPTAPLAAEPEPYDVVPPELDLGAAAASISGIGCPPGGIPRRCLVAVDEGTQAVWVDLSDRALTSRGVVDLTGATRQYGRPLLHGETSCERGPGSRREVDAEAVSFDRGWFYVVGSHGCSRERDRFRPDQYSLVRVSEDGQTIETSYRLSEVLRRSDIVGGYFGLSMPRQGLNIEGLVVRDGVVFAGLRAPNIAGNAYVVRAKIDELFSDTGTPAIESPIPIALGPHVGIRDLQMVGSDFLLLSGPATTEDVPFQVWLVSRDGGNRELLGTIGVTGDGVSAVPEAILPLEITPSSARVLVLFDRRPGGWPRAYSYQRRSN